MYVSRSDIVRMIAEANFLEPEGQGLGHKGQGLGHKGQGLGHKGQGLGHHHNNNSSSSKNKNKSKNQSNIRGDDDDDRIARDDDDDEEEDKCDLVSFAQFKTIASRSLTLAHGNAAGQGLGSGSGLGSKTSGVGGGGGGGGEDGGLDQEVARLWRKVATKPKVLEKGRLAPLGARCHLFIRSRGENRTCRNLTYPALPYLTLLYQVPRL